MDQDIYTEIPRVLHEENIIRIDGKESFFKKYIASYILLIVDILLLYLGILYINKSYSLLVSNGLVILPIMLILNSFYLYIKIRMKEVTKLFGIIGFLFLCSLFVIYIYGFLNLILSLLIQWKILPPLR